MTDEQLTEVARKVLGHCLRCDKDICALSEAMPHNPDGAMTGAIAGNYGSRHDLSTATVYLCDDCVDVWKTNHPGVFEQYSLVG